MLRGFRVLGVLRGFRVLPLPTELRTRERTCIHVVYT